MTKVLFFVVLAAIIMAGCSRPTYDWGKLAQGVGEVEKR